MTTEALNFTDPPDKHRRRMTFDWDSIYTDLKSHPAQWALIAEPGYHSTYNAIVQAKITNFLPSMGVEVRTANNDLAAKPRTCDLYVRYNPDMDTSLTQRERQAAWRAYRKAEKEKKNMVTTVVTEGEE